MSFVNVKRDSTLFQKRPLCLIILNCGRCCKNIFLIGSSSPRVQHPSFLFGSTSESSLTQTGGLAMGMTEEGEVS